MTEPLLSPLIGEYIRLIRRNNHFVRLTTNGFLLPQKAEELVNADVNRVQISIDGPRDLHDSLRGNGFFDRAIDGIRKLRDLSSDLSIFINFTVSNLNFDKITEFLESLLQEKLHINKLKIQFLNFVSDCMLKRKNPTEIRQYLQTLSEDVDPEQVDAVVLNKEIEYARKLVFASPFIDEIAIVPDIDEELMKRFFSKKGLPIPGYSQCHYPFHEAAIKTNGDVYFHMRCFGYVIGNIQEESMREIYNSKRANEFRSLLYQYNLCFPVCTRCCGALRG
jgi:sulfatase maturation enzyme AslB (radical SAM superfamily)